MPLLEHRLNIVTGKGGVGKSTVSAALALAAQARKQRVLVCEVTAKERVASLLGAPDSGTEVTRIDESIWSVHIRPPEAMREYALMVLRFKAIYNAVFENRLVRYFLRAIPSLPEIVMLGKVWWHVCEEKDERGRPRWDQVILDAPATGHGISFLRTPRTILEIVSDGPMVRDMKRMQAMLLDPALTAVNVVTLPEEMPVNEAMELSATLFGALGLPKGRLFLNSWFPSRFGAEERSMLGASDLGELAPARTALRFWGERQDLSAHYEERLRAELALPMSLIPHLAGETFDRKSIERIAALLGPEL
jgi:hypothetical protein